MSKIIWDENKFYETGVDHGVIYPFDASTNAYGKAVAWSGLTSVTESPSGAEASPIYADNIKYLNLYSAEEFGATIEAYTYPDEFALLDGSAELTSGVFLGQQSRSSFAFSYRTRLGDDKQGDDYGYKIHILYGCRVSPSQKAYQTVNDSPEAITFSWELTTTPVNVTGFDRPTATVTIDSSKFKTEAQKAKLAEFLDILYGTDATEGRIPLPDEIKTLLTVA